MCQIRLFLLCTISRESTVFDFFFYSAWPLDSPLFVCYLCRCPSFGWNVRHFSLFLLEARIVPSVLDHWSSLFCAIHWEVNCQSSMYEKRKREKKNKRPPHKPHKINVVLSFLSSIRFFNKKQTQYWMAQLTGERKQLGEKRFTWKCLI